MDKKRCTNCLKVKSQEKFYRYKRNGKSFAYPNCKECQLVKSRAFFKTEAGKKSKQKSDLKYLSTPKGKRVKSKSQKKYSKSPKGRAKIKLANVSDTAKARKLKYSLSRKAKIKKALWLKTPKGIQHSRSYNRKATESGRSAAYLAVGRAINAGLIQRTGKCSECGIDAKTQMHHPQGYSAENRLNVTELCLPCHNNAH